MCHDDVFDELDANDVWSTAAAANDCVGRLSPRCRQTPRDMMYQWRIQELTDGGAPIFTKKYKHHSWYLYDLKGYGGAC